MQSANALFKLFYFLTFCISFAFSLNSDGLSLLALKAAIFQDPNRALISWSELHATPCSWAGITCDRAHRSVISISLPSKNLTGYIPSEIGALSFLASLDLSQNFFSGPLPQQITTLQNLVHLDISSNNFNGSLPEGLSNLTHLAGTLNLSYNAFVGEIPASFGQFPVMVSLDLQHNNLTGKIPQVGSLLNQGPTAFSGNPYLCGFPLSTPCTVPEAQNPRFFENPQKPGGNGGLVDSRKINGGSVTVSVISGVSLVVGVVVVSVWVIRKKWKVEQKLGKENVSREVAVGMGMGGEEGKKGKFVVIDEGFGLELEDLLRASAYVLGKSRSGIVYRVVVGGGKGVGSAVTAPVVVAVRRLSEGDVTWRFKEFEAEVEAIGKVKHPNIVGLRAYYYASDEKLLISDFIRNGSLFNALHGGPGNSMPPLSWAERLRIIQETARSLVHIHECSPRKYVHGSIKSSKILLDDDFKPYLSGFGLSRLVPGVSKSANVALSRKPNLVSPKTSVSSNIKCMAPEARNAGARINQKCDVYSFGILVMEILTGRLPDNDGKEGLENLVRRVFREERPLSEIIDPALLHEARAKKQVVATFHVSLNCTEQDPELRPKMRTVSDNLDRIKLQ
ncbi:Leucine-rich repeat protein kinase family protein [Perilla frutescens var. hirtella]|uniref:Leucine-rich repeat protein kinase family protein n=1 Tax=Perilla frutescens var. hirtella TaxID=608512 RepID=A0AAD4P449_PERFH|nr:Leucine-rich repeat protein kinase family protein [Perilla frutescens var. hirtella]